MKQREEFCGKGRIRGKAPLAAAASATAAASSARCAGHLIDEIVAALLACGIADTFRDGIAFLLADARRANPKRNRKGHPAWQIRGAVDLAETWVG